MCADGLEGTRAVVQIVVAGIVAEGEGSSCMSQAKLYD